MSLSEPKIFLKSPKKKAVDVRYSNEQTFRLRLRDPRGTFVKGSYLVVPVNHLTFDNGMKSGVSLILARRIGSTCLRVQSTSFNRNPVSISEKIWTPKEARKWVKDHKTYLLDFSLDLKNHSGSKIPEDISTAAPDRA